MLLVRRAILFSVNCLLLASAVNDNTRGGAPGSKNLRPCFDDSGPVRDARVLVNRK